MRKIVLTLAFLASVGAAKAQELGEFFAVGKDAGTLMQSYMQPAFEGTMYNLNNGWYRTAKAHKLFGFDITLNASFASVPSERESFTFNPSDYNNLTLVSGSNELPTAFGGKTNTVLGFTQTGTFDVVDNNGNVIETVSGTRTTNFDALEGFSENLSSVPSAMIQAGIGLPHKTELIVRYVPESLVSNDEFSAGLFGVGVKHNILQYFPIAKRIPLVDVSVFAGYTKLNSEYLPEDVAGANQSIDMEITSMTAQLLGSVDLKIVNFFVGLGYTTSEADLNVNGSYIYSYDIEVPGVGTQTQNVVTQGDDLPSLSYDVNGFMTTAGASLNLGFFKIFGSYTIQEYNNLNLGFAFSFR